MIIRGKRQKRTPDVKKEYLEKKEALKKRKEEWAKIDKLWEGNEEVKSKIILK